MIFIAVAADAQTAVSRPSDSTLHAKFDLPVEATGELIPAPVTLPELEQTALQNNPTLSMASSRVAAARGRQIQGGLPPNPRIGYLAMDIGADGTAGQHGGFVGQEFITGGKLQLNRAVAGQEIQEMQHRFTAQEMRVLTDVRMRFYDALVAQRQVELARELAELSGRLAESSRQLVEGQQVSRSDLLQSEIEAEETAIALANAKNLSSEAWRRLAAVAGITSGPVRPLKGNLDDVLPSLIWEAALARVMVENSELAAARARVTRARIAIEQARRQVVPNIDVMASVTYMDTSDDVVAGVQAGMPLPIINRNQGTILEREAELIAADNNVRRLELQLQEQLAAAFRRYENAHEQVKRYRDHILPRAQQTLDLIGTGYREGQVDFLALLTSQRTYIRVNMAYLAALGELRQAAIAIEGNLLTGSLQLE